MKNARYDRQLRLWGGDGQKRLESSLVIMLGCNPVSCEALESLAASGLGGVLVVDDKQVEEIDQVSCLAFSNAQNDGLRSTSLVNYLMELNPNLNVKGVPMSTPIFIKSVDETKVRKLACDYSASRVLILSSSEAERERVDELVQTFHIHMPAYGVVITTLGPYARMRVRCNHHLVMDNRLPSLKLDLGLHRPFPALRRLSAEILSPLLADQGEEGAPLRYKSIPAVLLVTYAQGEYESRHNWPPDDSVKARQEMKECLERLRGHVDDECISEAERYIHLACRKHDLPEGLEVAFKALEATPAVFQRSEFVALEALQRYYIKFKSLPLSGQIPDMLGDSDVYLAVKRCFKGKADADLDCLLSLIPEKYTAEDRESASEWLRHHYSHLRCISYCEGSFGSASELAEAMLYTLDIEQATASMSPPVPEALETLVLAPDSLPSMARLPILFETARVIQENGAIGTARETYERRLQEVVEGVGSPEKAEVLNKRLTELPESLSQLCYSEINSLNHVSAVMGGVLASEALKILTGRFIPVIKDLYWDSSTSRSAVFPPFWS